MVNNKKLIDESRPDFLEFPKSKKSWFFRLYYEYIYFYFFSKKLKPDLWLSLHDISPNVSAKKRMVYCHNPSPFYCISIKESFLSPSFLFFNFFYKYLYKFNIKKNTLVIVQQNWMREEFRKIFKLEKILVAHPGKICFDIIKNENLKKKSKKIQFFYPSLPRVFKNFEVICDAFSNLPQHIKNDSELILTISPGENRYSKYLYKKYFNNSEIKFVGRKNYEEMYVLYREVDYVLFPSKLETWGLPITEAKKLNKKLFVSDLQYAKETVGTYNKVIFLNPNDSIHWEEKIIEAYNNEIKFEDFESKKVEFPYTNNWKDFWQYIINQI